MIRYINYNLLFIFKIEYFSCIEISLFYYKQHFIEFFFIYYVKLVFGLLNSNNF